MLEWKIGELVKDKGRFAMNSAILGSFCVSTFLAAESGSAIERSVCENPAAITAASYGAELPAQLLSTAGILFLTGRRAREDNNG